MEKLFFSRVITVFCFVLTIGLQAQDTNNYCVFQVEGKPMLIDSDSKPLVKGMFIYPEHSLSLDEGDKVILTDGEGVLYEINKKVTMPYARIERYTKKEKQSAFTLEYLKYVWQKLWQRKEKQNIGVVFRAPNYTQPIAPLDSVQIFMNEVPFTWQEPEKSKGMQYFYLQERGAEDFFKLATNGDTIILPADGKLLKPGGHYRWSVTPELNASEEDLVFSSFQLLKKDAFEAKLMDLNAIRREFMSLGLTEAEIKRTFCEDQKICFN